MKIKELIKNDAGFLYVVDSMELMSSAGRRRMLDTLFTDNAEALEAEWNRLEEAINTTRQRSTNHGYNDLRHCLMQLHDLQGTLATLASHTVLNEVELFEIKNLAYLCNKARTAIDTLQMEKALPLPDLTEVFNLLDPDHTGVVNFYIYDTYDSRLAPLRRELRALQEHDGDPIRMGALLAEQNDIQQEVCISLSDQLTRHHESLATAMEQMAYADFLLAKADLCLRWHLQRPHLGDHIDYTNLFNPRLRDRNEQLGLRYQPVSIRMGGGVTLITGANMAGKTVLLKSIGTAQLMVQCGLYAPAEQADTMLFADVVTSIGDEQNEMNGLSSYASEIIKISDILKRSRKEMLLVLIDEPARTTNPIEGKALVQALITIMEQVSSVTLITTHYGQLGTRCHRLRVKGFVEDMADMPLTPQNINSFIDYSLTEDQSDNVPHEALRIASILGCDEEMIALAKTKILS
ncbi:MAG: hypothetical protein IK058_00050 [Bacteroidales bacterium]|nr:hypothetical protein [Bacteroidales bacterium]